MTITKKQLEVELAGLRTANDDLTQKLADSKAEKRERDATMLTLGYIPIAALGEVKVASTSRGKHVEAVIHDDGIVQALERRITPSATVFAQFGGNGGKITFFPDHR